MPDEPTGPGGGVNLGTGGVADEGAESDDSGTDDSSFPGPGEGGGSSGGSGGGGGSDEPSGPGGGVNLGPGLDDPVQDEGADSDDTDRDGDSNGGGGGGDGGDGDGGEPTGPGGGVDLGPPGPDDTFDDPGGDDEPTGPGGGVNLGPGLDDPVQDEGAASDPQTDRLPPRGDPTGPGGGVNLGTDGVADEGIDRRPEPGQAVGVGTGPGTILPRTFRDVQRRTDEQIRSEDLRLVNGELRFSRAFRREQAAEGTPYDPGDIIIGGSGPRPTGDAQRELRRARRRGMIRGARLRSGGEPAGPGGGVDLGPPGPEGVFDDPGGDGPASLSEAGDWTPGGADATRGQDAAPLAGPFGAGGDVPDDWAQRGESLDPGADVVGDVAGAAGNVFGDIQAGIGGVSAEAQELDLEGEVGDVGVGDVSAPSLPGGESGILGGREIVEAAVGPPGEVESAAGDVAFGVRDASMGAQQWTIENVVTPTAEFSGDAAQTLMPESAVDVGEGEEVEIDESSLIGSDVTPDVGFDQTETVGQGADRLRTGPRRVETFVQVGGEWGLGGIVGAPALGVTAGDVGASSLEFTSRQIQEEGAIQGLQTSAQTGAVVGGTAAASAAATAGEEIATDPVSAAGAVAGTLLGGAAAGRAIEGIGTRGRVLAETRGRRGPDFEDITTERAAQTGDLPTFDTPPGAPTSQAVREVRQRAQDQPGILTGDIGDSITFRSEARRLGRRQTTDVGRYELPGMFTSPDASPLRLDVGAESSGRSLRPRLPNPFSSPQRLSAFETQRVEGMPPRAAEVGTSTPLPAETGTAGARFLMQEADPGTAFVRPTGARTSELEAIFPPGAEFARTTTRPVDVPGGRTATIDVFEQVGTTATEPTGLSATGIGARGGQRTFTSEDIIARERGSRPSPGEPTAPVAPLTPSTTLPTTTQPGVEDIFGPSPTTAAPSESAGVSVTESFGLATTESVGAVESEPTSPSRSGPSAPGGPVIGVVGSGSSQPPSTPTQPPTSPPGAPPSSPPSSPPSRPPGSPPGTPSQPPSTPPYGPPSQPPSQPPRTLGGTTSDRDDEEFQPLLPTGTEFENPIASGRTFLFGGSVSGENGDDDPAALFGF